MKVNGFTQQYFIHNAGRLNTRSVSPSSGAPMFGAIKKSHLTGLSLACACMFKAPLEKFNSEYDLHEWAEENVNDTFENSRTLNNIPLREQRLENWKKYLTNDSSLSHSAALVIYTSILKDLTPKNKKLPPPLNPEVLNQTIKEINLELNKDPKYTFNFNKLYQKNLNLYYLHSTKNELDKNNTGWVFIPSQSHDGEHFEDNINNLMLFSYKTWCTKSYNAPFYLAGGDFHIYLEDGNPKAVIRMYSDYIVEIQGERNDKNVPWQYLDIIEERIKDKQLDTPPKIQDAITEAHQLKEKILQVREELAPAIKKNDIKTILNYFNMGCKKENLYTYLVKNYAEILKGNLPPRKFEIEHFFEPEDFTLAELGINENNIFKQISKIRNSAEFTYSSVTNLGNLEQVGGKLSLYKSPVSHLGKLKTVGGRINVKDCPLHTTGRLESVNGIQIPQNILPEELPASVTYL